MGESSSDIQREITQLRSELGIVVDELETRSREAMDFKSQARRHPRTTGCVALLIFGAVVIVASALIGRLFHPPAPAQPRKETGGLLRFFLGPLVLYSVSPWLILAVRNVEEAQQMLRDPGRVADFLRDLK
ncbi:MAG: hypothetical protein M1358_16310 [Chloroflexi bacterium]|nr:hypothetical protein [Chloroflexota bacterium]